jgi:DNA replication protein DnaC
MPTRRRPLRQRDLERMNLPRRFWKARLSNIQDEKAREAVRKYLLDGKYLRGEGLFISGKYGVGKSSIASIILMEMRRRGYSGLFVEASELVDKLMSREMFDMESSWSQRAKHVEVLVLDDIGTEHHDAAGAIERMLEGIIRYRLQRERVVILTSNISPRRLGPHKDGERDVAGVYRKKFMEMIKEALYPIGMQGSSLRREIERDIADGYKK